MKLNKFKLLSFGLGTLAITTPLFTIPLLTSCSKQQVNISLDSPAHVRVINHTFTRFVFKYELLTKNSSMEILSCEVSSDKLTASIEKIDKSDDGTGRILTLVSYKDTTFPPREEIVFDFTFVLLITTPRVIYRQTYVAKYFSMIYVPPEPVGTITLVSSANVDIEDKTKEPRGEFKFELSQNFPVSHFIMIQATNRDENIIFDGAEGETKFNARTYAGNPEKFSDEKKDYLYFKIIMAIKDTAKGPGQYKFSGLTFSCMDWRIYNLDPSIVLSLTQKY